MPFDMSEEDLRVELATLKVHLKNVREDINELKTTQKELVKFMHLVQSGKLWLFGLLALAGSIGGFISNIPKFIFQGP